MRPFQIGQILNYKLRSIEIIVTAIRTTRNGPIYEGKYFLEPSGTLQYLTFTAAEVIQQESFVDFTN